MKKFRVGYSRTVTQTEMETIEAESLEKAEEIAEETLSGGDVDFWDEVVEDQGVEYVYEVLEEKKP